MKTRLFIDKDGDFNAALIDKVGFGLVWFDPIRAVLPLGNNPPNIDLVTGSQ